MTNNDPYQAESLAMFGTYLSLCMVFTVSVVFIPYTYWRNYIPRNSQLINASFNDPYKRTMRNDIEKHSSIFA